jgi:hypothetical protein
MNPPLSLQKIAHKILIWLSKNTEFDADFESVKKVVKSVKQLVSY